MLVNSGIKELKIKIYPKEGEKVLSSYTRVGLTLYFAPDKDSRLKDYQKIATFKLPEDIAEQKLPYYEGVITFKAEVPFDYSQDLEDAVNIEKLKSIEKKIVSKYNELREMCINNDVIDYNKRQIHSSIIVYNTTYENTIEEIEKSESTILSMVDSRLENKEVLPIENYIIQFYAEGKIVALWQKDLNPMLYVKGTHTNTEGFTRKYEYGDAIFLYMPKGSKELIMW